MALVQSSLSNIPLYMMPFYLVPVGVRKWADFFKAKIIWKGDKDKNKYHLIRWDDVCNQKNKVAWVFLIWILWTNPSWLIGGGN